MSEDDSYKGGGMWRAWIPSIALIVVALAQVTLAKTAALCPWKGGGFGMFSTNDATAVRDVRVFLESPVSSEEVEIPPAYSVVALQAKLFPSDSMLTRLALAVVSGERSTKHRISAVKVEIWRTEYGTGSLEAKDRLLRTFIYDVPQSAD